MRKIIFTEENGSMISNRKSTEDKYRDILSSKYGYNPNDLHSSDKISTKGMTPGEEFMLTGEKIKQANTRSNMRNLGLSNKKRDCK